MAKEEWQYRYEHRLAVRNAQVAALNNPKNPLGRIVDLPKDEKYGTIKRIPNLGRTFSAEFFWPELRKRGHTSMMFEACSCFDKYRKERNNEA